MASSNLSFEFSEGAKAEIKNMIKDLAKEAVDEVRNNPIERKTVFELNPNLKISWMLLRDLAETHCSRPSCDSHRRQNVAFEVQY